MKSKVTSRILSWALTAAMLLGMLPISALASDVGEHVHETAGVASDGYYYTGECTYTEGADIKSEIPDLCGQTEDADHELGDESYSKSETPDLAHVHSDACYSVTKGEGTWDCVRTEGNAANTLKLKENITVSEYHVTFDDNLPGRETYPETPCFSADVESGETLTAMPEEPKHDGYSFTGWYENEAETAFDFTTVIVDDLTLFAQWEKNTEFKVEHYFKNVGTYPSYPTVSGNGSIEKSDPTNADILDIASAYAIPMDETKGKKDNLYYAFKRAEVAGNANDGWTLKLYYNSIQFFINTNGIPGGEQGTFTPAISGTVGGVEWETRDTVDTSRIQYKGDVKDMAHDVETQGATLTFDQANVERLLADKNYGKYGVDYTIRWYTVHEGYFIHVDGYVQMIEKAPTVTYHSNYPSDANLGAITSSGIKTVKNAVENTWEHTILNNTTDAVGIPAPVKYTFNGWKDGLGNTYAAGDSITVGTDAHLYAQWKAIPPAQKPYTVQFYYQQADGTYPTSTETVRNGTSASDEIAVTDADKVPTTVTGMTYVLDIAKNENWTGKISEEQPLKVYFKLQFTVTYQPGTNGTFAEKSYAALNYGDAVPVFTDITGQEEFQFTGWDKVIPVDGVKENLTFVAQWKAIPPAQKPYTVQFYYQQADGTYPTSTETARNGLSETDDIAVIDADKVPVTVPGMTYVLDSTKNQNWSGTISGGQPLKVYFKLQFTVTYQPGTSGTFAEKSYAALNYGDAVPVFTDITGQEEFQFTGWDKVIPVDGVKENLTFVAQWEPITPEQMSYTVEFYYQQADGTYPASTQTVRNGLSETDDIAVSDADKVPATVSGMTYVLDSAKNENWTGKISEEQPLKVYFKLQFTVTYQPGIRGTFTEQSTSTVSYGDAVPAFVGATTGQVNYRFIGWDKVIPVDGVKENLTFVAQWEYTGGDYVPGPDPTPTPPPAITPDPIPNPDPDPDVTPEPPVEEIEVEIIDEETPLANLPPETNDKLIIEEEEVPLGDLPQTGSTSSLNRGAFSLMLTMSALTAGLALIAGRKREDDAQ